MRNAVLVPLHLDAFVGQNLTFSHQISVQLKTSEHFRAHFFVFRAQFLTKRRHFRPDPFLSCAERWQDLRAVHDSRDPCSEKCPFLAGFSRGVSSDGGLRGISDAWRANLAANWRFSRPRLPRRCMRRKNCHGLPPGNAPRRNLATDRHSGTHRARILPLPVRPRVHQGAIPPPPDAGGAHCASILPSSSAWERTVAKSCHYQSPENAFRAYPAIAGRLGMHSVDTLPLADIRECTASAYRHCQSPVTQRSPREGVGSGPWLRCGVWRTILSVRGSGHSVSSGLNCWERFRVCAVSVGNHELASRSAKLCRIMC